MCGVLGVISKPDSVQVDRLRLAQQIQLHRGPDGSGEIHYRLHGRDIFLAHQRLAIIDLTSTGNQPMGSLDDTGILIFNGELYNYLELRNELINDGITFEGNSDTEVALRALSAWGPAAAMKRFNGMWAFAWLEPGGKNLWLSRDRAGEKPLYWYQNNETFYFASEVKGLLSLVGKRFALDMQSVGEYLIQSIGDTGQRSFFAGINLLPAANIARLDLSTKILNLDIKKFWLPPEPRKDLVNIENEIPVLREIFEDSVRLRLRSAVPTGVLLSGGLDSSAIVAACKNLGSLRGLTLLTAISGDIRFDESQHAKRVARYLGANIDEVNIDLTAKTALELLNEACYSNDAPVASFSNVAHYLLMRRAKDIGVKVILSGQGADELLCGYKKYLVFYLQELIRDRDYIRAAKTLFEFTYNKTFIEQFSIAESMRYLPTSFSRPLLIAGKSLEEFKLLSLGLPDGKRVIDRQILDFECYSIPTLTHSEDRISMALSREIRLPFLDYRLIDYLLSLPVTLKMSNGWSKFIMRKVVEPWLPDKTVWRRDKQGFINPESEWLKNDLAADIKEYFSSESLIFKYGLVNQAILLGKFERYKRQKPGRGKIWFREIFNPLALEIWLRRYESHILAP